MSLNFKQLRLANIARLPQFKNKHGELAHSKPDGSDWGPAQWCEALVGEIGEYANFHKKFVRGDITREEFEIAAGKELADVQTYLDLLAMRCLDLPNEPHPTGLDLGRVTLNKFNEVSARVGSTIFLIQRSNAASNEPAFARDMADTSWATANDDDWIEK